MIWEVEQEYNPKRLQNSSTLQPPAWLRQPQVRGYQHSSFLQSKYTTVYFNKCFVQKPKLAKSLLILSAVPKIV